MNCDMYRLCTVLDHYRHQ